MMSEVSKLRQRAGHDVATDPLPSLVEDSWRRCLENYNLAPDAIRRANILTYRELQDTLGLHEDLVQTAIPEIERLFLRLVDNEYIVSIGSPEGIKLLFRCDHQFLGEMSTFGVLPGSIWSEEVQGTNGIGTCLKTGKALSIIGDQHFNQHVQNLSCTVAPVFGAGGRIESVVNVTSSRPVNDRTARVVRDIVERSARRIENRHFARRNARMRTLCLSQDGEFTDIAAEARLAVDDGGRIVDLSSLAPQLLRQPREALLGANVSSLMDFAQPLDQVRVTRTEMADNGRELYATLLPDARLTRPLAGRPVPAPPPRPVEPVVDPHLLIDQRVTELLSTAERMLNARIPVVVHGETGVGKTAFARLLMRRCQRGEGNVLTVNCAAPEGVGSDVFDLIGRLQDFTLVLDHVDEMPMPLQARLLHMLSEDHLLAARNIGLISLSSCDLSARVQEGALRADLYHRLKGAMLELPPLRNVPKLESHIRDIFAHEMAAQGKPAPVIDDEVRLILANYHWPGNLRELRQAARHAAVLSDGADIRIGHLPEQIVSQIARKNLSARSQSEASRIEAALRHNAGNVSETARYLGISRATLYRKIQIKSIRIPEM